MVDETVARNITDPPPLPVPGLRPGLLPIVEAHRRALLAEHGRQERYGEIPQLADAKIHRRHRVALRVHARPPVNSSTPRGPQRPTPAAAPDRALSAGALRRGRRWRDRGEKRPGRSDRGLPAAGGAGTQRLERSAAAQSSTAALAALFMWQRQRYWPEWRAH